MKTIKLSEEETTQIEGRGSDGDEARRYHYGNAQTLANDIESAVEVVDAEGNVLFVAQPEVE